MTKTMAEVLYQEGAWCGVCEYEGWDACSECRSTCEGYAAALSAAGFGLVADAQAEPGSAMQEAMRLAWDEGKNAVWTFMSNQDPRRERPTNPYRTEASS